MVLMEVTIYTHGDTDGICAGALAHAVYTNERTQDLSRIKSCARIL